MQTLQVAAVIKKCLMSSIVSSILHLARKSYTQNVKFQKENMNLKTLLANGDIHSERPLWVVSRLFKGFRRISAYAGKQTFRCYVINGHYRPKADINNSEFWIILLKLFIFWNKWFYRFYIVPCICQIIIRLSYLYYYHL